MNHTVDAGFKELDANLNLEPFVRKQAQDLHNDIRETLRVAGAIVGSFLQGSFARKTMLKPLKDVDIVCLLPRRLWEALSGPHGPGAAMESFKAPIAAQWPGVQFDVGDEPSGKALRLTFPGYDFTVDLVPAFELDEATVVIGDRFEGTWEPTNSRTQIANVATRNQACGGRFVHQVREVKALTKHHPELDFVSGIVVESLAYAAIFKQMTEKDAVAKVLAHAAGAVGGPVYEPAGDDDVTVKWTAAERARAARVYGRAADRAREALRLEAAGDEHAAMGVWHDLFGEAFPAPPTRAPAKAAAAWAVGSMSSGGRPSTTTAGRQNVAPTRSWAPAAAQPWTQR